MILKKLFKDSSKPLAPLTFSMIAEDMQGNKKQLNWEQFEKLRATILSENKIEGVSYDF